jgi:hypothetical protein
VPIIVLRASGDVGDSVDFGRNWVDGVFVGLVQSKLHRCICICWVMEFWSGRLFCTLMTGGHKRTIILLVLVLRRTMEYHCQVSVKLESRCKNRYG